MPVSVLHPEEGNDIMNMGVYSNLIGNEKKIGRLTALVHIRKI